MPSIAEHTRLLWQDLSTRKVFLACSGGVDSMVLLHLLYSLKVDLSVIHVNYQLRENASEMDAELVKKVCSNLNIPVEVRTVELKKVLETGGNLQNEARKVRYNWFHEILAKDSNHRIALAHHKDDQLETFLLNLGRKSGVLGLASMKAEHNGIIRPLLDFSKAQIRLYAQKNAIQWREDQSNQSNSYARNRLRNEFIPLVNEQVPTFSNSVYLLIDHFQQTQSALKKMVHPILDIIEETQALPIDSYLNLSEWEQVELLRQLDIDASYAIRLTQLTERGKRIELTHSKFNAIVRDEHHFTFLSIEDTSFELEIESVEELPTDFSKEIAYFDAAKIRGQLSLRKWEIGDRIEPLGMKGSQLISDIIKDAKISASAKQQQLVVHDDRNILWCVGLKISRKALPNAQSKHIIRCSINASKAEESEVL